MKTTTSTTSGAGARKVSFEEQEEEERVDRLFNYLVDEGALELISIDPESEEPLYRITPKCEEILPELYYEFQSEMNQTIFDLWQLGIIDIKFGDSNGDDLMRLSADWHDVYMSNKDSLEKEHKNLVYNLIDDNQLIKELEKLYDEGI